MFLFFFRYQDENTQAFMMVVSTDRWIGLRLEILCAIYITAVAIGALVIGGSPGLCTQNISQHSDKCIKLFTVLSYFCMRFVCAVNRLAMTDDIETLRFFWVTLDLLSQLKRLIVRHKCFGKCNPDNKIVRWSAITLEVRCLREKTTATLKCVLNLQFND